METHDILDLEDPCVFLAELKKINYLELHDKEFHLLAAKKFEHFGDSEKALKEYNLAVRDGCEDSGVLEKIGDYWYDLGKGKNAVRAYERILQAEPAKFEIALKLATIYEELDQLDKEKELFQNLFEKTGDSRYQKQLKEINDHYFQNEKKEEKPESSISDSLLLTFIDLFSGREGVYARQWINEKGEAGYSPVHEHLSPQVVKNHLLGNHTIGIYQLRLNDTVNWGAIDVDISKKYWADKTGDGARWEELLNHTFKAAQKIRQSLMDLKIPAYLEYSGFKGYHLWFFLKTPLPAYPVKIFLNYLVQQSKISPDERYHLEIYPKQTQVKKEGLGNLIKLPLGIHRRSNDWSFFFDPTGQPLTDRLAIIQQIKKVDKDQFYQALDSLKQLDPAAKDIEETEPVIKEASPPEKEDKNNAFDPYTCVDFNFLISRCQVLQYILDKIKQKRFASNDEKIVVKFTLGNLDQGVELVNHFLGFLPETKESDLLKTKFSGNPISCPKIRKRLPLETKQLECNCNFEDANTYPHPLVHLQKLQKHARAPLRKQEAEAIQFQNTIQQYLKLRNEINERQLAIKDIEKYLHQYFDDQDVEEIVTSIGVVRRIYHPSGYYEFMIKL